MARIKREEIAHHDLVQAHNLHLRNERELLQMLVIELRALREDIAEAMGKPELTDNDAVR